MKRKLVERNASLSLYSLYIGGRAVWWKAGWFAVRQLKWRGNIEHDTRVKLQFDRRRVFENGTGFVWHGGGTQEEHAVKRALIVEMKAGLVTVHEAEGGFGGEIIEGVSEAIERIGGLLGGGFIFEEPGFDGQGAAEAPVGSDHILDHAELHAIGGLEAIEVVIHDRLKTFGRFILHHDLVGEQAMFGGILRRTPFALGGDRTDGASAIGPGRKNAAK